MKWKREDITPEILRTLLHLDDSGVLYWRARGPEWFQDSIGRYGLTITAAKRAEMWNGANAGRPPNKGSMGVLCVNMPYERVVWMVHHGQSPKGRIVILDGDRGNTSPSNLMDAGSHVPISINDNASFVLACAEAFDLIGGRLFWKARPITHFKDAKAMRQWNDKWAKKEALASGIGVGRFFGKSVMASHVAWVLQTGKTPIGRVSRKNENDPSLEISNLIEDAASLASHRKGGKNAISGIYVGVYPLPNGQWGAEFDSKNLGRFDYPASAAKAYDRAAYGKYESLSKLNFPEDYGLARPEPQPPEGYFD